MGGRERACKFGGVVLVQRREWPENDRALLVLTLHPAEVGVCIRLAVEHLIDEALLVVALDIPGPPSETTFVADAGRRQRAESFSAGTARTVTRKDLDMIWLRDERPLQTAEDLFGTLETGVDTVGSFVE